MTVSSLLSTPFPRRTTTGTSRRAVEHISAVTVEESAFVLGDICHEKRTFTSVTDDRKTEFTLRHRAVSEQLGQTVSQLLWLTMSSKRWVEHDESDGDGGLSDPKLTFDFHGTLSDANLVMNALAKLSSKGFAPSVEIKIASKKTLSNEDLEASSRSALCLQHSGQLLLESWRLGDDTGVDQAASLRVLRRKSDDDTKFRKVLEIMRRDDVLFYGGERGEYLYGVWRHMSRTEMTSICNVTQVVSAVASESRFLRFEGISNFLGMKKGTSISYGYSALIFDKATEVTLNGINKAMSFAQAGLPVVFVGQLPSASPYYSESRGNLWRRYSSEHCLELPALLEKMKVQPDASFVTPNTNVFSFKRWDPHLENQKEQKPYTLDTWWGEVVPIAAYKQSQGRLLLDITLVPGEYRLITLSNNRSPGCPVEPTASSDVELVSRQGSLVAKLFDDMTHTVALDNGTGVPVQPQVAGAIALDNWTIDAKSWVAVPDNSTSTGYTTESIHFDTTNLTEFGKHPILANISGTAVYRTTFAMGSSPYAHIDLGICSHTCNISINGVPGPALNILRAISDISDLLAEGVNRIQIQISTPLGSFLRRVLAALTEASYLMLITL
ncbi:hypothetical protein QFC19_000680 [Naganishia cerealis]|uniref:Uncharacterized protein n=1 Tax=Naganishia cerealis TaxID=610337 RepID=A0ACC2WLN3_9TREE|nr:hypothetical protein QFC19_000680 [Naganishia cerealis]